MDIKITCDYTKEDRDILVCSHETTGDTLSIMAGDLVIQINVDQAKNLVNNITIATNRIQEYSKMIKRTGGNGT